ncbi:MAG TPA: hypothetical protein VHG91_03660 [Longimicrobium sp.]|nr:hypothetical protein [Longimicrobium sp.]
MSTLRTFKDGGGKTWRVWHVVPQSQVLKTTSPDLAAGWLCFENDGDKRRLANPPAGWHDLPDTELVVLLGTATAVKRAELA